MTRIEKGWGHERVWADWAETADRQGRGYTGKILHFARAGNRCSLHFHRHKVETWLVTSGRFQVVYLRTHDGVREAQVLEPGEVWHNGACQPHQLIALEDGSEVVEVSTPDDPQDNFRIAGGDSQCR